MRLSREGVHSRVYGPARPVDGPWPRGRARRIFLVGESDSERNESQVELCRRAYGLTRIQPDALRKYAFVYNRMTRMTRNR